MTIELEHKPGSTEKEIREAEREFKDRSLAGRLGISYEKLQDLINQARPIMEEAWKKEFQREKNESRKEE